MRIDITCNVTKIIDYLSTNFKGIHIQPLNWFVYPPDCTNIPHTFHV